MGRVIAVPQVVNKLLVRRHNVGTLDHQNLPLTMSASRIYRMEGYSSVRLESRLCRRQRR